MNKKSTTPDKKKPKRRTPRAWDKADADQRRELIVNTAMKLLQQSDVTAVTMRRVASKLSVGVMTLYTYFQSQRDLQLAMIQRGFEILHSHCQASSTLETAERWRGGAKAYLTFATSHPNLYRLMFETDLPEGDGDLLAAGFAPLVEKVEMRLAEQGMPERDLRKMAMQAAGRYWIALHGLASLANAGRLDVLQSDIDTLLDEMLERVAPD